jgi:hypothetical protein
MLNRERYAIRPDHSGERFATGCSESKQPRGKSSPGRKALGRRTCDGICSSFGRTNDTGWARRDFRYSIHTGECGPRRLYSRHPLRASAERAAPRGRDSIFALCTRIYIPQGYAFDMLGSGTNVPEVAANITGYLVDA